MSFATLRWALSRDTGTSDLRNLLVTLANHVNEEKNKNLECWPSIACLVKETYLCRRTIIKDLDVLESKSLIKDTGKKIGKTSRVKVYSLVISDEDLIKFKIKLNGASRALLPDQNLSNGASGASNGAGDALLNGAAPAPGISNYEFIKRSLGDEFNLLKNLDEGSTRREIWWATKQAHDRIYGQRGDISIGKKVNKLGAALVEMKKANWHAS